jgi:hypothetical protein
VIDVSASMIIWQDTAAAFRSLLERQGAFRNVRAWAFDSDEHVGHLTPFGKRASGQPGMRHSPAELVDPTGRRAVLILTDAVGAAWYDGTMAPLIAAWARCGPVAIIQVLPRRLWHRTALEPVVVAGSVNPAARPPFRAARADGLRTADLPAPRQAGWWVPVLSTGADWLGPWAAMVSGAVERTELFAVPLHGGAAASAGAANISAVEQVRRFREREASAIAAELAEYLSAAPLSLPVMRLVQRAMLPRSGPEHLAEVFLSGLLVRADGSAPGGDPDAVVYEFRDGVREQLLGGLTQPESLRVQDVISGVSGTVASLFGGTLNFRALVPARSATGAGLLPPESRPFARVAASVLSGLGGSYRELARTIAEAADDEPAAANAGLSPDLALPRPSKGERPVADWHGSPGPGRLYRPASGLKIGIWGAPGSGKTTYLAALNFACATADPQVGRWRMAPSDETSKQMMDDLTQRLVVDRTYPDANVISQHHEFRWNLAGNIENSRYARRRFLRPRVAEECEFDVELVDASGEVFGPDASVPGSVRKTALDHLESSDGLLFLFDPITERDTPVVAQYAANVLSRLQLRAQETGRMDGRFLPYHVAVCITKTDDPELLRQARRAGLVFADSDGAERIPDSMAEDLFNEICAGRFWDKGDKDHLGTAGAQFVRDQLRVHFRPGQIRYYAVSAVGHQTSDFQDGQQRLHGPIKPFNVLEPLVQLHMQITGRA